VGKAAAKAVGIPLNTHSNSGALCSAEYSDTAVPAQHNFSVGMPAAAAAVAGVASGSWQPPGLQQMQVGANAAGGATHTPQALHAAPSNDTSQSGIDCTPRQHSGTAAGAAGLGVAGHGALSAAAPVVTTGSSAAGRLSNGNMTFTPRAMETDAPGLGGKQAYPGATVMKQQVVSVLANASGQQPQLVVQQQRSSGRDVHGPDQAALLAASNLMKVQASMAAAAAAAGGSSTNTAPTYLAPTALQGQGMVNTGMTQQQQQAAYALLQRQQAAVAAAMQQQLHDGAWAEQPQAVPQQLDMAASGAASRAAAVVLSNATGVNQQLLLQQLLQQQEIAAGLGYVSGSADLNQQVQPMQPGQEQFGGPGAVMVDRLLPWLQR
jgi:hypothetical protein